MSRNDSKLAKFFKVLFIIIICVAVIASIGYMLYTFVPAVQEFMNNIWNWILETLKISSETTTKIE